MEGLSRGAKVFILYNMTEPIVVPTTPVDDWVHIGTAANILGVAPMTIRRWERKGHITPKRDDMGHRIYRKRDLQVMYHRCYGRRCS